ARTVGTLRIDFAAPESTLGAAKASALRAIAERARGDGLSLLVWTALPEALEALPEAARRTAEVAQAAGASTSLPPDRIAAEVSKRGTSGPGVETLVLLLKTTSRSKPTPGLETPDIPELRR
ncbi:MAG: hypothetical protein ACYC8T_30925, partial [Myxococcaceae bacterium]